MRPLMESFFRWVREARATATGRTLASKALGYAANQEPELLRVLEDLKLPLDNTRAERAVVRCLLGGLEALGPSWTANGGTWSAGRQNGSVRGATEPINHVNLRPASTVLRVSAQ